MSSQFTFKIESHEAPLADFELAGIGTITMPVNPDDWSIEATDLLNQRMFKACLDLLVVGEKDHLVVPKIPLGAVQQIINHCTESAGVSPGESEGSATS